MTSDTTVTEKDFKRARRLARSFKDKGEDGPELFDDAESNMNVNFNKSELEFPDDLDSIDDDLKELRKNTDPDTLINDSLMQSALNIYIENAMSLAKKNNMIDVGNWDDLGDVVGEHQRRDRELLETSLNKLDMLNHNAQREQKLQRTQTRGVLGDDEMKVERDQGLLQLAERGQLFDIKMDNVYRSVGDLQVKNFEKFYGVKA